MAKAADDVRNQLNELWNQAIDQLEEVKDAFGRSRDRIDEEMLRLRGERDNLLKKLGEQTHRLANDGRMPVPSMVKRTVDRLNDVIDNMTKTAKKKKKTKKKTRRKAKGTKKTAKKKITKKKTAKKKTTRKTAKKAAPRKKRS